MVAELWNHHLVIGVEPPKANVILPVGSPRVEIEIIQCDGSFDLNDRGRTLQELAQCGEPLDDGLVEHHLAGILKRHHIERHGFLLSRVIPHSIQATDLQRFAQAMCAILYLRYLHQPRDLRPNAGEDALHRLLQERQLKFTCRTGLTRQCDKIVLDYSIETPRPIAIHYLRRGMCLSEHLELWRYRWNEARQKDPHLLTVMLYDPESFYLGNWGLEQGAKICSLFCSVHEIDRIKGLLDEAMKAP
jgi:hypothetical protein